MSAVKDPNPERSPDSGVDLAKEELVPDQTVQHTTIIFVDDNDKLLNLFTRFAKIQYPQNAENVPTVDDGFLLPYNQERAEEMAVEIAKAIFAQASEAQSNVLVYIDYDMKGLNPDKGADNKQTEGLDGPDLIRIIDREFGELPSDTREELKSKISIIGHTNNFGHENETVETQHIDAVVYRMKPTPDKIIIELKSALKRDISALNHPELGVEPAEVGNLILSAENARLPDDLDFELDEEFEEEMQQVKEIVKNDDSNKPKS